MWNEARGAALRADANRAWAQGVRKEQQPRNHNTETAMTTTTLNDQMNANAQDAARPTGESACMQHGLLDGGPVDCPQCRRQAYRVDDEGDRATLRAFRKATLKARVRNFAIGGYVGFAVVKSAVLFLLGASVTIELLSAPAAVCAGLGAALAYLARRPSQRRLDRLLG